MPRLVPKMPRGKLCPLYEYLYQLEDVNSVGDTSQWRAIACIESIHKAKYVAVAVQDFCSDFGAIYSVCAIFKKSFAIGEQRTGCISKVCPRYRLWHQQSHRHNQKPRFHDFPLSAGDWISLALPTILSTNRARPFAQVRRDGTIVPPRGCGEDIQI